MRGWDNVIWCLYVCIFIYDKYIGNVILVNNILREKERSKNY